MPCPTLPVLEKGKLPGDDCGPGLPATLPVVVVILTIIKAKQNISPVVISRIA
jgi:hypothetical protein